MTAGVRQSGGPRQSRISSWYPLGHLRKNGAEPRSQSHQKVSAAWASAFAATARDLVDGALPVRREAFDVNAWAPSSCHADVVGVEVWGFDLPVRGVAAIDELEAGGVWISGMLVSAQALVRSTLKRVGT